MELNLGVGVLQAILRQSGKASLRRWHLNWDHLNELLPGGQSRGGCTRQKLASTKSLGHESVTSNLVSEIMEGDDA